MLPININKINLSIIKYWPCLLVLLAFVGFVSKALYNYPIAIMAILGLYKIVLNPRLLLHDEILKIFTFAFLCLWLPLLISYPDAVNKEHSLHTILPYLRFYFAGIFIIEEISKNKARLRFIVAGVFFIVLFWSVDASIQFFFKNNLFGFPYTPGDITGMFYPRNTISHICSILSSLCFLYIYTNVDNKKWLLLSLLPLFFILLLSGRRAAWVMLMLSSLGFFIYGYVYAINRAKLNWITGMLAVFITIALGSTIVFHPPTQSRVKITMGLFSNDYETINKATAVRLPIWETSYSIFKSNPINGIGPRGFRHIYNKHSSPNDYYAKINAPPTQPHILILEILAETGLIGFAGYILLFYIILKVVLQSRNKEALLPYVIPVIVSLFPFNTHMAFYGSIWSSIIWLLLAIYFTKAKIVSNFNIFSNKISGGM